MNKKMLFLLLVFLLPIVSFATDGDVEMVAGAGTEDKLFYGLIALGSGLGLGLAVFGGALGQAKAAAAALDGIARNPQAQPKIFIPMIISLALIESLVIYMLIIAFVLAGKVA